MTEQKITNKEQLEELEQLKKIATGAAVVLTIGLIVGGWNHFQNKKILEQQQREQQLEQQRQQQLEQQRQQNLEQRQQQLEQRQRQLEQQQREQQLEQQRQQQLQQQRQQQLEQRQQQLEQRQQQLEEHQREQQQRVKRTKATEVIRNPDRGATFREIITDERPVADNRDTADNENSTMLLALREFTRPVDQGQGHNMFSKTIILGENPE